MKDNHIFVRAVCRARKRFEALRSFTLESGQQEIERHNQRRKASAEGTEELRSPSRSLRNGSFDNVRSPQSTRTPSLSNVPEEDGTFTIGDDEDSEEDEREPMATPSHSSSSNQASQSPSRSSSIDEPLPTQLRGMSEKARGKMPANQSAFSRQSSSTSLNSHFSAAIMSPTIGFSPSAHWVGAFFSQLVVDLLTRFRLTPGCPHYPYIPS